MTSPRPCVRCRQPADESDPGGLCLACRGTLRHEPTGSHHGETETAGGRAVAAFLNADSDAETPLVDSRFELCGQLGRGGMGVVWKVRERATGQHFALKTLRGSGGHGRFQVEAQALTRLRHPNIIRVFEIDLTDDVPYFTMELVEGGSLEERVRKDGPLDPAEAARVIEVMARAVDHAHRAGVIHRDLKPGNVLVTPDGDLKVTDFGLAKRLDRVDGRTTTLASLGTPGYMAPEQVTRRFGRMGPATDVYGLGATLFRLLTGRPTVETAGKDTAEVIAASTVGPVPDPRAVRPDLPEALATICRKCLQKAPGDRYPSAAALADDLSAWLDGRQPRGRLPSRARRAFRAVARRWELVVGGLLIGAVVALAITLVRRKPPDVAPPEDPLAQLQADFRNGRAEVIPAQGLPRWERWVFRKAAFGESSRRDGIAAFDAATTSMVDLFVPDQDRYRVSVELRQLRANTVAPAGQANNGDFLGLVIGRQERALPDGTAVHVLLTVRFSDHLSPEAAKLNQDMARIQLSVARIIHEPGRLPSEVAPGVPRAASFRPAESLPGPWRRIEADVSPDGVRVRWQPTDNARVDEIAALPRDDLVARVTDLMGRAPAPVRESFRAAPYEWDPKAPLGLYAGRAYLAVRNLTVVPLPTE